MRIGILTGGGDVPGLNPCIKAVVNARRRRRPRGASASAAAGRGLLELDPDDPASAAEQRRPLTPRCVRTIDRTGGTILHTSRTNPGQGAGRRRARLPRRPGRSGTGRSTSPAHVLRVIEHLGLDALIPIGGDDTLSYALRLHDEGVPVIAIPKTMDNDVHGTDYCIGFSTAVTRGVEFIHALRTVDRVARAASPSSSCSAATAARRRWSPRTSPASTGR